MKSDRRPELQGARAVQPADGGASQRLAVADESEGPGNCLATPRDDNELPDETGMASAGPRGIGRASPRSRAPADGGASQRLAVADESEGPGNCLATPRDDNELPDETGMASAGPRGIGRASPPAPERREEVNLNGPMPRLPPHGAVIIFVRVTFICRGYLRAAPQLLSGCQSKRGVAGGEEAGLARQSGAGQEGKKSLSDGMRGWRNAGKRRREGEIARGEATGRGPDRHLSSRPSIRLPAVKGHFLISLFSLRSRGNRPESRVLFAKRIYIPEAICQVPFRWRNLRHLRKKGQTDGTLTKHTRACLNWRPPVKIKRPRSGRRAFKMYPANVPMSIFH
ncbi:hypothetical protein SKAU_G00188920 [Synaphobranchus kaupii]|uniref:Uncharacterized protein n=1 Tax=Synaphobranchus kaupii TaxID=118154 RepID=A0A9Q1FDN0_SYNKA|nr:hypothetical protein SKAU_G00188920 [Synaphobranchus kaupii]